MDRYNGPARRTRGTLPPPTGSVPTSQVNDTLPSRPSGTGRGRGGRKEPVAGSQASQGTGSKKKGPVTAKKTKKQTPTAAAKASHIPVFDEPPPFEPAEYQASLNEGMSEFTSNSSLLPALQQLPDEDDEDDGERDNDDNEEDNDEADTTLQPVDGHWSAPFASPSFFLPPPDLQLQTYPSMSYDHAQANQFNYMQPYQPESGITQDSQLHQYETGYDSNNARPQIPFHSQPAQPAAYTPASSNISGGLAPPMQYSPTNLDTAHVHHNRPYYGIQAFTASTPSEELHPNNFPFPDVGAHSSSMATQGAAVTDHSVDQTVNQNRAIAIELQRRLKEPIHTTKGPPVSVLGAHRTAARRMAPPSPYELAEIEHRRSSIISSGTQSTSTAVNTSAPSVTSSKVKYRSYGGSSITSSARSESFTQDDRRNLAVASTTFLGDILPIDAWIGGESKKDKAREALNQANSMTTTVTTDINARTITRVGRAGSNFRTEFKECIKNNLELYDLYIKPEVWIKHGMSAEQARDHNIAMLAQLTPKEGFLRGADPYGNPGILYYNANFIAILIGYFYGPLGIARTSSHKFQPLFPITCIAVAAAIFEAVFAECAEGVHKVAKLNEHNRKAYTLHVSKLTNLPKEHVYYKKVFKRLREHIMTTGSATVKGQMITAASVVSSVHMSEEVVHELPADYIDSDPGSDDQAQAGAGSSWM